MHAETPPNAFRSQVRVYYEDTDAGGVVYYANYLKFFERARTDWLRELGVEQSGLADTEGQIFVVRNVEIRYRKPARLDDLIDITSRIVRVGPASIEFHQSAHRHGELLCESDILVGCIQASSFRPDPLTPSLKTLLEKARN